MAFDREQQQVGRELFSSPLAQKAGPKVRLALAETDLTESSGRRDPNLTSEGSAGPLQQTPADGWGTLEQVDNPRYAATQFLKRALPIAGKYGTAGQLAQAVQRSAYPERYDEHSAEAAQLLHELGVTSGPHAQLASLGASAAPSSPNLEPVGGPSDTQTAVITQLLQGALAPQQSTSPTPTAPARPQSSGGEERSATAPKVPQAEQASSTSSDPSTLLALVSKLAQETPESTASTSASSTASTSTTAPASASPNVKIAKGVIPNARGGVGFTPGTGTTYDKGVLPELSQRLNALAQAHGLKLTGISGYRTPQHSVEVGGFADDPHTKGLASDTEGTQSIPKALLNSYGLERPFPGSKEADHIQLLGSVNKDGGY